MKGRIRRDRRGSIALLTALMIIPIVGLVGLAIDFAIWSQANAALGLAANAAAMNAVKIAGAAAAAGNNNYLAEGVTAGQQWFTAQIGAKAFTSQVVNITPTVTLTLTSGNTATARVTASATVKSVFGSLFSVAQYPLNVEADAALSTAPYLEVIFMLDVSSSMLIGATNADIAKLSSLSPCDPSNAFYGTSSNQLIWSNQPNNAANVYMCSSGGNSYDGVTPCPVTAGSPLTFQTYQPVSTWVPPLSSGETCQGKLGKQANGMYPVPGAPCAFACHWTNTASGSGSYADLFGMARRNGVTLRFDLLKNATNAVLSQMQSDNLSFNNLSVGIYTFNKSLTQVYPTNCTPRAFGCEAGSDFATAQAKVGTPPVYPAVTDTGLVPSVAATSGNNDDTAVPEVMTALANTYVTAAGNGTTAATPRKVLFLVTDGFTDDPYGSGYSGLREAFEPSYCTPFKTMGYTVYVIYTPYYPLMHISYLQSMMPIVEGAGPTSIAYNLQACASSTSDYTSAADQTALNSALLTFFAAALNGSITLTK